MWGGRTKDFLKEKSELASSVHCFDPLLEFWDVNKISGVPPPGPHSGACASAGHYVYQYGGTDGSRFHSSLHQLDTRSWTWKQLSSAGPMMKRPCGDDCTRQQVGVIWKLWNPIWPHSARGRVYKAEGFH